MPPRVQAEQCCLRAVFPPIPPTMLLLHQGHDSIDITDEVGRTSG